VSESGLVKYNLLDAWRGWAALWVVLYHGYKAFSRLVKGSNYAWVNLVHALWVGPLLIYIGANKKDTLRPAYELLLLTAFGALGYHIYALASYST